nr:hypothetical protein CFP56_14930 [Quercus suber]
MSAVKCLIWAVLANGDFDTKSAYNLSKDIGEIKESLFNGQWVLKLKTVKLFQGFKLLSGCAFITVLRLENASLKEVRTSQRTAPSAWMVLTTESIILALRDCIYPRQNLL